MPSSARYRGRTRSTLAYSRPTRIKTKVLEQPGSDDELVETVVSAAARRKDPSLPRPRTTRRIGYRIPGFHGQFCSRRFVTRKNSCARNHRSLARAMEVGARLRRDQPDLLDREEAIRSQTPGRRTPRATLRLIREGWQLLRSPRELFANGPQNYVETSSYILPPHPKTVLPARHEAQIEQLQSKEANRKKPLGRDP